MDQNRCLLDVIDNPQLLQSFLESESIARPSENQEDQPIPNAPEAVQTTPITIATKTTTTTGNLTTPLEDVGPAEQQEISGNISTNYYTTSEESQPVREPSPVIDSLHNSYFGFNNTIDFNNPNADPVVSVLDSLISETVAETSPSRDAEDTSIPTEASSLTVETTPIAAESMSITNESTSSTTENADRTDLSTNINNQEPTSTYIAKEDQQKLQSIDNTNKPPSKEPSGPEQKVLNTFPAVTASISNNGSPKNKGNVTKTPETKPKRAPRTKKIAKTSAVSTTPSKSPATTNQTKPIQTQYVTNPQGQQILFQNNNGIRPQTMLSQSTMGQPLGGVPQQQRVIQIQTANGPMYFAIAPGPAATMNNSPMVNQQQQPGIKSQFPSQPICFQPNSNMILNRPQLATPMAQQNSPQQQQQSAEQQQSQSQTQQQPIVSSASGGNIVLNGSQMMQPQHQSRLPAPVMPGQIAIPNQQNSHPQQQQQHVVLSSSQPVMMPRAPNQLVVNRQPGQLLPGQQQFIQILTPNGPMLLALPTQQAQPMCNTMLDYNNGQTVRHTMPVQQNQQQMPQQQQQLATQQSRSVDTTDGSGTPMPSKQANSNSSKRSGLDLADLLLDCGILPDDRTGSQSSNSIKSSQSPSISQISSPLPTIPQISSPLPSSEPNSLPSNHTPQPAPNYLSGQPTMPQQQQHQVRISFGPDGQMIMQPAVYGAMRPVLASPHMNSNTTSPNMMPNSPMMMMTPNASSPSAPNNNNNVGRSPTTESTKKGCSKGKGTATKRGRSKKSDIDNFPQLKTPKIAQQQQQQQQQMQAVTVVPMTVVVGDQNKVLAAGSDVKPNVGQLASGQQVSVAKFVTPVMQSAPLQSSVSSNLIQTSVVPTTTTILGNQTISQSQQQVNSTNSMNNQLNSPGNINSANAQQQKQNSLGLAVTTTSSGNVTTNLMKIDDKKSGTVESNPHISSSLMPTLSLPVDTLKFEQNGQTDGQGHNQQQIKGIQFQGIGGVTTTLVLKPLTPQQQQQHQQQLQQEQQLQQKQCQEQLQQQQLVRQLELRTRSILNQLGADQNAALNPQTKQSFLSIEDACKRLLRYHVFATKPISEAKIRQVDEIFEAAVESLITRKQAIYDKFRLLILKQSMRTVPTSEEVMLDQVFINDELAFLKRERELFKEYEAHLESMAIKQAKADSELDISKDECAPDYFAFGNSSPRQKSRQDDHLDNPTHSRDADDWLLTDKWGESRFPSVPDSEAATAIESILNEEIS